MKNEEIVNCWFCGKEMKPDDKKCINCGEWIKPKVRNFENNKKFINETTNKVLESNNNYILASRFSRLMAYLINSSFFLLIFFLTIFAATLSEKVSTNLENNIRQLGIFLAIVIYVLSDGLKNGQSLGKRILKITVIDKNTKKPCSYFKSFLRNIGYFLILPDIIPIFFKDKQRVSDKIANTIVISKVEKENIVKNITSFLLTITLIILLIFITIKFNMSYASAENPFNIGEEYYKKGNYQEAIEQFKKVISVNPKEIEALNYLGSSYSKEEKYQEAIKIFKKVIELTPNDKLALDNLALTYAKFGIYLLQKEKYQEAIEQFNNNIASSYNNEIDPHIYQALGVAYSQFAYYYYQRGEYMNSLKQYQKSLDNYKKNPLIYYNLACNYSLINNKISAIENLNLAIIADKKYKKLAIEDKDFNNIKNDIEFINIVK